MLGNAIYWRHQCKIIQTSTKTIIIYNDVRFLFELSFEGI